MCGFVRREIVGNHDVTWLQGRGQLGLDIGFERSAVHWSVQDPGRTQFVDAQTCDEGLRAPMASSRVPRTDRPRRRAIFVVTAVSSMNTSLCGSRRILGIRRWRHSYRAARTRLRRRSVAISDFFYM